MSWTRDAVTAIRSILLIEDRIVGVSEQVKELMEICKDLDRRLIRIEAKFELLEKMATPPRRQLPEKSEH